jgi:hypothetical protein
MDIARATVTEVVSVLRWAASSRDQCKAWDDRVAVPLAEMVAVEAARNRFHKLDDIKDAVGDPSIVGHPDLEGLEVRISGGVSSSGYRWGGLKDFAYVAPVEGTTIPTCCTSPECTGTDFRCSEPEPDDLLRQCEPPSPSRVGG